MCFCLHEWRKSCTCSPNISDASFSATRFPSISSLFSSAHSSLLSLLTHIKMDTLVTQNQSYKLGQNFCQTYSFSFWGAESIGLCLLNGDSTSPSLRCLWQHLVRWGGEGRKHVIDTTTLPQTHEHMCTKWTYRKVRMRSGGSRARVATLEPTTTDSCSQESAKNEEKITASITAWHGWHWGCFPVPNREASVVASRTYTGQEAVTSFRENTYTHMVWVEEGGHYSFPGPTQLGNEVTKSQQVKNMDP